MRKSVILIAMTCLMTLAFAGEKKGVKRPESFNYQRAMEAFNDKNPDEALDYFKRELKDNDKNGYVYYYEAIIYDDKDDVGTALQSANKALKYIPSKDAEYLSKAYRIRSNIYLELRDTLQAINDLDAAIKLDGDNIYAIDKRGDLYYDKKEYEKSNEDYLKIISIDETSVFGHMGYGRNLQVMKKYDEALEQYNKVISMHSDYSSGYSFRADVYQIKKNWTGAADDIVKALGIDGDDYAFKLMQYKDKMFRAVMIAKLKSQMNKEPGEGSWPYYLGIVTEDDKRYMKAIDYYKKSYELTPNSSSAERVSQCYAAMGMEEQALEYNALAFQNDSTDFDLVQEKADILYYMGDTKGAIAELDKYVEHYPDFYGGYYRRGFYKDNANMVDEAIEDYTMAIALDSTYAYAYLGRADQYMKKGEKQLAMADYRKTAQCDTIPTTSSCAFYAFLALGEKDKAIAYLDSCLNKFPKDDGTHYDAACLYSRMGDKEKALAYLKDAFELGFRRFKHMEMDDDMDNIRNTPEYKALVNAYKAKFQKEVSDGKSLDARSSKPKETVSEVPFTRDYGNTCTVKCSINELPLKFVFDTGASDVSMSQVEATFMMKNGYLSSNDVVGKAYFSDANGNVNVGTVLNLKHVNFGGIELSNIKASVVRNQKAPLLLGQSVFQKLGKIEIDNDKRILKITRIGE